MQVVTQDYTNPANYTAGTFEFGFNATHVHVQITTNGPGNIQVGFGAATTAVHALIGPTASGLQPSITWEVKKGVSAVRVAIVGGNCSCKVTAWN